MARRKRKPASVGSYILSMIVFLGIGGFFLVTGFTELMDSKKIPVDFNTLSANELEVGMVIEGDLEFNMGKFMESYTTKYGVKTGSSTYYYVIPAGGESSVFMGPFMSLKGNTRINSQLDSQAKSVYSYLQGYGDSDFDTVHIKGKLKKMSNEDKGYLKSALAQMGYEGAQNMISPYTFQYSNFDTYGIFFIAGGIFFLIGFLYAIPGIVRLKKQKSIALGEGYTSYGAESVNPQNPYGNGTGNPQNPYGGDMNAAQNPYGGDMNATQNPYGGDMNATQNPYGGDMNATQNPYGNDNNNNV